MRGKKAKQIRERVAELNVDATERRYVERQIRNKQQYVEYFDADTYQQKYTNLLTGETFVGAMPKVLKGYRI